jgi:hypothetical protein
VELARNTFLEGCVGETIAALAAERAATRATDPQTKQILTTIAQDEARHAALAWRTVRWAIDQGGDEVRESLREAWRRWSPPPSPTTAEPDQAAWGRLSAAEHRQASLDAWAEIVEPMLEQLVA